MRFLRAFLLNRLAPLFALNALLSACSSAPLSPWEIRPQDPSVRERSEKILGSTFRIRIWMAPGDRRDPEPILAAGASELRRISALSDDSQSASEVSRVNERAFQAPVRVSKELFEMLAIGQSMWTRSGGIFDVTFAPIQEEIEKFGPDAGLSDSIEEFTPASTDGAKARVGNRDLALDPARQEIRFLKAGMKIVVRGVAKGYAAQRAAEKLAALRPGGFAVVGGGVVVAGGSALKDPNLMCVENAADLGHCLFRVYPAPKTRILAMAASASSDRPGHIYNPKNGNRSHKSGEITIAGPDGAWAQAAAIAASAMDDDKLSRLFAPGAKPVLNGVALDADGRLRSGRSLEPYAKLGKIKN